MADRISSTHGDLDPALDWDDLRVFLAVARSRSLRGAARALGVNHATVARRLEGLERALGAALFERRPEGLVPTRSGEALLEPAERVEQQLVAAQRRIAGRDAALSGRLRISLPYALMQAFLAEDIAAFARLYPGIDLEIALTDAFSDLARREADVSIRMAFKVTGEVVRRRLLRYGKTTYAAPAFLERFDAAAPGPEACWLGWSAGDDYATWPRDTSFPQLPVRHHLASHALQIAAAAAGLGLTLLPCFLGDRSPGLVRVPGAPVVPDRSLWLLLHDDLRHTARVRAFLDFVGPAILARRALLEGTGAPPTPSRQALAQ
ncbi:transcriptional regulator, LysR family [Tistlia consotensis]|uniref:Transcriptional regulator, LysR family n=1 Tax=Tistlia consotensis USBA 355 TaxID=560819 RepID=A0A1Y6BKM6_9PROT|nr:LysR family transcriptional regulator [Tistlia consotensis]SMF16223.1 transcriptional regulator, LysR family [Tistlia consotensis USBA 355]SNR41319.1 transcriptional regulator, LysR family [Tistlia consotensis]